MGEDSPLEIDVTAVADLRRGAKSHKVLDVREPWEVEICSLEDSLTIPMGQIPARLDELPRRDILVVLCHHGQRSYQVAAWLRRQGFSEATSVMGGIDAWAHHFDPEMARY